MQPQQDALLLLNQSMEGIILIMTLRQIPNTWQIKPHFVTSTQEKQYIWPEEWLAVIDGRTSVWRKTNVYCYVCIQLVISARYNLQP